MKNILLVTFLLYSCAEADFVRDSALEVVNDTDAKLMWQDDSASKMIKKSWSDAIDYCDGLDFAGEGDWRLPNSNELYSIADRSRMNPATQEAFVNSASIQYWSSTTSARNIENTWPNAWFVDFTDGLDSISRKTNSLNTRCVRDAN